MGRLNQFLSCTVLAVTFLLIPGVVPASQADSERMALAEQIATLQGIRDFYQAEWDHQRELMMEYLPEGMDMSVVDDMMGIAGDQMVDGRTEEWVQALAESMEPARLRDVARTLDSPEYQAWVSEQLAFFPAFLRGVAERMEATSEVLVEDFEDMEFSFYDEDSDSGRETESLDFEAVEDSPLTAVFQVAPGARVEKKLPNPFMNVYRVPATHTALAKVFPDYEVQLVADGDQARVSNISAERGYDSQAGCEADRQRLESALAGYFTDSEVGSCGHIRHLSAGGDTRMSLHCREQSVFGGALLRLSVTHQPTERAAFSSFMVVEEDTAP